MDYNKIGEFIMHERKNKKLTQAKLAEKLFVSEKTVSKWENGNGIPDTDSLPKLCEIFDVSLTELLNGERLNNDSHISKAEEKLLELQKEKEKTDKRLLLSEIVLGSIATLSFLLILGLSLYAILKFKTYTLPITMICVGSVIFLIGTSFCLYIEQKAGYYICKKCNHKYIPTFKQVFFAMHINRSRYLKCPHCKQKSWHKKILK